MNQDDLSAEMPPQPKERSSRWQAILAKHEEQVFLLLTLLIGALVGLAVVAFILVTEQFGARLYPAGGAAWRRLLMPVLGSFSIGYFLYRFFPNARGSGVPQTKAALYVRDGHITLRTVLGKFLCTAGTLANGIPLGREGPAVQVGAGIASVLGRRIGLSPEKIKALIPVGASAAIAAAFNTPLAAVLFSLEEVVGDLHAPVLGSVVLASATSWAVLRLLLGNDPLFHAPQYQLVHPAEFAAYAVLGVAGGIVSVVFTRLLAGLRQKFLHAPRTTEWIQPVAGGVLVGVMGWYVPQALGVGYVHVGDALNDHLTLKLMAVLLVLKLVSVAVCYASGNAGGIFGPSLFMGAMLGGVVGMLAHHFFPGHTATPGAYALVGMGTAFAGIIRAPMTSVMMIFEITRDYAVIVPLMISNLVSFFIASRLQREPIYEVLARQDGIHLPKAETRAEEGGRRVSHAMRSPAVTLSMDSTVGQAVAKLHGSELSAWPVCKRGAVIGLVSRAVLENAATRGWGSKRLQEVLTSREFPHLHADQSLMLALERMRAAGVNALPVVSRADVHQLVGILVLEDVFALYRVRPADEN